MQVRTRDSATGVCHEEQDAEKQGAQLRPQSPSRPSQVSACACAEAARSLLGVNTQDHVNVRVFIDMIHAIIEFKK